MTEFKLTILEADSCFYEGPCVSLVVSTTEGLYGVMAHHENMISALVIGEIRFTDPEGSVHVASISGGLMKVEDNEVLILVESCEDPDEIDEARAQDEQDMANDILSGRSDRINYRMAKGILARAVNRLKIKKRYGKYN